MNSNPKLVKQNNNNIGIGVTGSRKVLNNKFSRKIALRFSGELVNDSMT